MCWLCSRLQLIRSMFSINPLENLKLYISSRPPLVVFMISVSAMAIAFLTLGYFFKIKEIKSPEMAEVQYTLNFQLCWMDLVVNGGQLFYFWGLTLAKASLKCTIFADLEFEVIFLLQLHEWWDNTIYLEGFLFVVTVFFLATGSHVAYTGLELQILLPLPQVRRYIQQKIHIYAEFPAFFLVTALLGNTYIVILNNTIRFM